MSPLYPELPKLRKTALDRIKKYSCEFSRAEHSDTPLEAYAKDLESISESFDRPPEFFTCLNSNYWRVLMSPNKGYLRALLTNAYVYAACQQLSWSKVWLFLAHLELTSDFQSDFDYLWTLINEAENHIRSDIDKGISFHDQGRFHNAIEVYDRILAEYPHSAHALYEKAYSLSAEDPVGNSEIARALCAEALKYDPFYEQAYVVKSPDDQEVYKRQVQPFLRAAIKKESLFRDFAYGCSKLRLFEIAGHTMFQLMAADPENRDLAFRFIVCLTEYGVDEFARTLGPTILPTQTDKSQQTDEMAEMRQTIKQLLVAGRYREAQSAARQGLDVSTISFGANSLEAAGFNYDLGNSYIHLGQFGPARQYLNRALEIYEEQPGASDTEVGFVLNSLSSVYMQSGQLGYAETCLSRVIDIWSSTLSPTDCELALAYHNLGSVLVEMGRETEARENIRRAIYILDHTYITPSYSATPGVYRLTLAKIERHLGNLDEARELATEASELLKSALSTDHPDSIRADIELADIYADEGEFEKSISHLEIVLATQQRVYGLEHPLIAYTLNNLARAHEGLKKWQNAEELYLKSLEMREKLLGPTHPDVATPLNNLGLLYARRKRLLEAERFLLRALEIREQALPENHPDLVQTLHNLGLLEILLENYDKALGLLKQGLRLDEELIRFRARSSNQFEKALSFTAIGRRFEVLLNLVSQHMPASPHAVKSAFEAVINRKGLMGEILATERTISHEAIDPGKRLRHITNSFASLAVRGAGIFSARDYVIQLEQAADQLQEVEIEMSSAESYAQLAQSTPGGISDFLPGNAVLIEYIKCPIIDFSDLSFRLETRLSHYFAFVLRGGSNQELALFDLGPAECIDALAAQYSSEMKLFAYGQMSRQREEDAEQHLAGISRQIYELLVAPLLIVLDDTKDIYVAPDATLHVLPFGALQDEHGLYLVETYEITYLSTARDLLRFRAGSGRGIFIVADPDYDMPPFELRPEAESTSNVSSLASFFANQKWQRLSGTKVEARAIAEDLRNHDLHIFVGQNAREDLIKQFKSPQILHIATHGFFLENDFLEAAYPTTVLKKELVDDSSDSSDNKIYFAFPPLLRSGLVFAGANFCSRVPSSADVDDGILTALEVSSLELSGTDLVVLSACETGLGDTYFGDAVVGLRRAFQVAGAQTLVSSLWSVPDEDTTRLMIAFYRNIRDGQRRSTSLQLAMLETLNARRAKGEVTHPFYWGAFICVGNPGIIALST